MDSWGILCLPGSAVHRRWKRKPFFFLFLFFFLIMTLRSARLDAQPCHEAQVALVVVEMTCASLLMHAHFLPVVLSRFLSHALAPFFFRFFTSPASGAMKKAAVAPLPTTSQGAGPNTGELRGKAKIVFIFPLEKENSQSSSKKARLFWPPAVARAIFLCVCCCVPAA